MIKEEKKKLRNQRNVDIIYTEKQNKMKEGENKANEI